MKSKDELDLVSKLNNTEHIKEIFRQQCCSPDDGKYGNASEKLIPYLTPHAEWKAFAWVQLALLRTRYEFGQAKKKHVKELEQAIKKIDTVNMQLLENQVTKHDQLAVLEEIGRHVSEETAALLHPGTTSYDIIDTARAWLFRSAWYEVIRPEVVSTIEKLINLGERFIEKGTITVGRTHMQYTSPVYFGTRLISPARRLTDRVEKADAAFDDLRGQMSGIVGTGAGIEMIVGEGKSIDFEREVLKKFGLEPDYTATQITQKERIADVGHAIVTLDAVLGDFAGDIRLLYASGIQEVTTASNAERLGGSSTDAAKNNPISYENIEGKVAVVETGMPILYRMIPTDLERDLRSSVQGRYQPQLMMVQTFESFKRMNRALDQLILVEDNVTKNLQSVRDFPSEAMVTILKGEQFIHPVYGISHDFVKQMSIQAKKQNSKLITVCLDDEQFRNVYDRLPEHKQLILNGDLEKYMGSAVQRAEINVNYIKSKLLGDKK